MGETLQDLVFGTLVATPGSGYGTIEWRPDQWVGVSICREDGQDIPTMLAVARRSLECLRAHEPEAKGLVADQLQELYNDSWTDREGRSAGRTSSGGCGCSTSCSAATGRCS
jgi:hypothetical protein